MKRFLLFAGLLFTSILTLTAQPRAEIVATDLGSCGTASFHLLLSETAGRIYVIRRCSSTLRVDVLDTNLQPIASPTVPTPSMLIAYPIVDSRGHLYLLRVANNRQVSTYHVTPAGTLDLGSEFFSSRAIPTMVAAEDGILIASAHDLDTGTAVLVHKISHGGDTLWRWLGATASLITAVNIFVEKGGRIRVAATGLAPISQDFTTITDAMINPDGSTVYARATPYLDGNLGILNTEPAPGGGIYVMAYRADNVSYIELLRIDSGQIVRWQTSYDRINDGLTNFRATEAGDLYVFDSDDPDGENVVDQMVRKIAPDGRETWRRRTDLDSGFTDTIATVSGITAMTLDRHGDPVFAGTSQGSFVYTRLDNEGGAVWTVYRPHGADLDERALVPHVVASSGGSIYALTTELSGPGQHRQTLMKITQNIGAGVSRDEESSAASEIFATEPSIAPNPATDAVSLRFTLVRAADVTIGLFDLAGEKLATIAKIRGEAGENLHEFSLRSAKIPSGAYLVKISAGGEARTVAVSVVR